MGESAIWVICLISLIHEHVSTLGISGIIQWSFHQIKKKIHRTRRRNVKHLFTSLLNTHQIPVETSELLLVCDLNRIRDKLICRRFTLEKIVQNGRIPRVAVRDHGPELKRRTPYARTEACRELRAEVGGNPRRVTWSELRRPDGICRTAVVATPGLVGPLPANSKVLIC